MKRLLTLVAMFLCCMATTFAQFSGSGSGTEEDPYLILNPIQLNQLRNFLNVEGVYFKMMANIDLTEFLEDENPDQGWQPVGNSSSAAFKGILDGNGKTIKGVWIKRASYNNVGFFGYTDGATIKNLIIEASTIEGNESVAGLSGYSLRSTISGCSFSGAIKGVSNVGGYIGNSGYTDNGGHIIVLSNNVAAVTITGTGDNVGGFIGKHDANNILDISDCILNDGNISGVNNVGGCCGDISGEHKGNSISSTYIHANISGADNIGGLCGASEDSYHTINLNNCGFCGEITGSSNVGGLVGKIYKSWDAFNDNIQNSFAIGSITSTGNCVGGLVGYDDTYYSSSPATNLSNCYHSGAVSGQSYVGGLVGSKKCGEVSNCYAIGSVAGSRYVGGLLGYQKGHTTLKKSVAINTRVTATTGDVNRMVGYNAGSIGAMGSTDENKSYNRTIIISQGVAQDITDNEMNGTSVSATTLKLKATYVAMGWDFTDIWAIQEMECYPYMKSQTAPPVIQSQVVSGATTVSGKCVDGGTVILEIDGVKQQMVGSGNTFSFTVSPLQAGHEVRVSAKADGKEQSYFTTEVVSFLGKGTESDPYQISTAADLTQVYRKGYYKQMNDIDLTNYINQFSPSEGWQSIGRDGSETIHFDGDGHKITGLWCNSTRDNTGLFSCFANGTIKNLTVVTASGKQVKGGANTGIIIGKMINGTIENCRVSGNVADGTPVGGLVGLFDGGKISLSQANVTINTTLGTSYVGGLVGEITGGEIDQCVTQGTITATGQESYVGGLIGKNSATVTNCYSNATVTSPYNAAGLIAYNYGVVDKCYATGDIFSNNYGAGVIGYNDGENAVVKNCVAMNNKIDLTFESQQVQQGGGYGQRIIGGIKNSAPAPELNNYALKTMQVSLNNVPQPVYDDIMNGVAKAGTELVKQATYQELGWSFTDVWSIAEDESYPSLKKNAATVIGPPVTITAKNYTIEYGDDLPTFEYTCDGTITGTPSIACEATKTSPVGTYPIVISKGSVTNNNVTYVNGTLTIKKAPLKITAKDYSIKQGEALPTFEAIYEGFKNSETSAVLTKKPVITTTATSASEPGEYDITVSGAEAKNYDINYINGKLTIEKPAYILGDANGDGVVNVTDIVATVNCIMDKPSDDFNKDAADLNGDGIVNVTDIVQMVNIIMNGNGASSRRAAATSSNLIISENNIQLKNADTYTAVQFDINLSDGQSISNIVLNGNSNHSLSWKMIDEKTCRVVVYSMANAPFLVNSDNLFTIFMNGSHNATISNEILIKAENTTGIDAISPEAENGKVYDLNGRQVKNPRKGLYIINGRKVIVK